MSVWPVAIHTRTPDEISPSIGQRCNRRRQHRRVDCARDPHPRSARELDLDHPAVGQTGGCNIRSDLHRRKADSLPCTQLTAPTIQLAWMKPRFSGNRRHAGTRLDTLALDSSDAATSCSFSAKFQRRRRSTDVMASTRQFVM
jgi:hypothetical protein